MKHQNGDMIIQIGQRFGYGNLGIYIAQYIDRDKTAIAKPVELKMVEKKNGESCEPTITLDIWNASDFLEAFVRGVFEFKPALRNEFIPPANEEQVKALQQEITDLKAFIDKYINKPIKE